MLFNYSIMQCDLFSNDAPFTSAHSIQLIEMKKVDSPYLENEKRLADVIAAIQTLATYKFYKLPFSGWADRITGDAKQEYHWKYVFEQHPEFFRLDSKRERASLVWRRQHRKLFHVDLGKEITRQEFLALSDQEKDRVSRTPLDSGEITALIDTAIKLYGQALESRKDQRWLITALLTLLGVVLGAGIAQ